MYLTGKLEIDPSQTTKIRRVKEFGLFKKFLSTLTLGKISPKQEHETFTAVSILQQIYMGLHSFKIENIIRLSVDDYDFYLDESGKDNDLETAMFEFSAKVDPIESELFNDIFLVLEHLKDSIKYLIEIRISRKHKVGEYPIVINVNGIFPEYKVAENETVESLQNRIRPLFENQEHYDKFISNKLAVFNKFLDELELAAKRFIKVDNVIKTSSVQVIRPRQRVCSADEIRHDRFANPVYYGYFDFDSYFFYSWIWAGMMYESNIYAKDFYLVDDHGKEIFGVGENGFNAGEYDTLNPDMPFKAPSSGELEFYGDNDFSEELLDANLINNPDKKSDEINSGADEQEWLDIGGNDNN